MVTIWQHKPWSKCGPVFLVAALVGLVGSLFVLRPAPAQAIASTYYVATTGSDTAAGSLDAPFATLRKGLTTLRAGDVLYVRGGTYVERLTGVISPGTAAAPIEVKAYPGERPVVEGLLWLSSADYWTVDGLNVTWSMANAANEHMVKMTGGVGWRITNAEIWGGRALTPQFWSRG